MPTQTQWDFRFLDVAKQVANWSKDPIYRHGTVVVKNRRIVSTGYNGFPKEIPDHPLSLNDRELKRKHVIHSEDNAIKNCLHPDDLIGSTFYISGLKMNTEGGVEREYGLTPCLKCATAIADSGAIRVVQEAQTETSMMRYGDDAPYFLISANTHLIRAMTVNFI